MPEIDLDSTMNELQRRGIIIVSSKQRDRLKKMIQLPELVQSPPSRQQRRRLKFLTAFAKFTRDFPDRPRHWRRRMARAQVSKGVA